MWYHSRWICTSIHTKRIVSIPPLTSSPLTLPDQNRCEQAATALHWSGFLSSFDAARAHLVRNGSWFSSLKQPICWKVAIMRLMADNCALLSLISSSYKLNACKYIIEYLTGWQRSISRWKDMGPPIHRYCFYSRCIISERSSDLNGSVKPITLHWYKKE